MGVCRELQVPVTCHNTATFILEVGKGAAKSWLPTAQKFTLDYIDCSKCERQGHNLFYVDNTAQVRGGLRGTLGEE